MPILAQYTSVSEERVYGPPQRCGKKDYSDRVRTFFKESTEPEMQPDVMRYDVFMDWRGAYVVKCSPTKNNKRYTKAFEVAIEEDTQQPYHDMTLRQVIETVASMSPTPYIWEDWKRNHSPQATHALDKWFRAWRSDPQHPFPAEREGQFQSSTFNTLMRQVKADIWAPRRNPSSETAVAL